jgi:hypothetical protein
MEIGVTVYYGYLSLKVFHSSVTGLDYEIQDSLTSNSNCLPFASTMVSPRLFVEVRTALRFSLPCYALVYGLCYCAQCCLCLFVVHSSLPLQFSLRIDALLRSISTRVTRWSLVEQELFALPEHLSSPSFLVGFGLLNL